MKNRKSVTVVCKKCGKENICLNFEKYKVVFVDCECGYRTMKTLPSKGKNI